METTSDWSSLPQDLLVSIAKLTILSSVEDFMAFRATCTYWYLAGGDNECLKRVKPRIPFLMIPEKAEFYSLSRKKRLNMMIPFHRSKDNRFTGLGFGWVLKLETSAESYMMCPFSGARIRVPSKESRRATRAALSADPSETSDYVLVVFSPNYWLEFWRPGDQNWTRIKSSSRYTFTDLVFSRKDRMFYAVTYDVELWAWDMNSDSAVLMTVSPPGGTSSIFFKYLAESSAAELLLVKRREDNCDHYEVYQLDDGSWKRPTNFKDAIFIGNNASFSVSPHSDADQVIRSNCIYFITHLSNVWTYNISDGNVEHLPIESTNRPLWIAPYSMSFMAS